MIIFNNLGHTFKPSGDVLPIVWVDSSDNGSYTLSGNDVLTLNNKGSLGGIMTLNGSVKFANSGFESWSASDYITRDLGEPFFPTNSFTIAITVDLQNFTSGSNPNVNWFFEITGNNNNYTRIYRSSPNTYFDYAPGGLSSSINRPNVLGVQTFLISFDIDTNNNIRLFADGYNISYNPSNLNNTDNPIISLMRYMSSNWNLGADNPLHEFRLYNRAFDLTEMQNLQTELNNKYTP